MTVTVTVMVTVTVTVTRRHEWCCSCSVQPGSVRARSRSGSRSAPGECCREHHLRCKPMLFGLARRRIADAKMRGGWTGWGGGFGEARLKLHLAIRSGGCECEKLPFPRYQKFGPSKAGPVHAPCREPAPQWEDGRREKSGSGGGQQAGRAQSRAVGGSDASGGKWVTGSTAQLPRRARARESVSCRSTG